MARAVTVIPPTIQPITHLARNAVVRRRVAAYARVSTSSEEQITSYEAQVDYYTRFIQSKPEWAFVRVYTDEGISAVNTKKREGFNQMVRDALDGKIDLIVTIGQPVCPEHRRQPGDRPQAEGEGCGGLL